ncbi:MAG: hypothetical protein NVS3B21_09660 [Acidimicrobiales bacterium]
MDPVSDAELGRELAPFAGGASPDTRKMARIGALLAASARRAGVRAVLSGQWTTGVVLDALPHITIRSAETLRSHYGLEGDALADALVTNAVRSTSAIGAAMGTLAAASEASGAGLVTLPLPVIVDAVATALVEVKLIAELHEALGHPIAESGTRRALMLAEAWAGGRGVSREAILAGGSRLASGAARRELRGLLRRRLARRTRRSLTSLAPALLGAAAAAELNRRGTRKLAATVRADLAAHHP